MTMNNSTQGEIESGCDLCPSCKSDSWKSAKMVVLEGTTNIKGTLDGAATDPGKLFGGIRNFLLSDRWFSWDYPLEAEIGFTSSTGLVDEVKRLMVAKGSHLIIPAAPVPPKPVEPSKYLSKLQESQKAFMGSLVSIALVFILARFRFLPDNVGIILTLIFLLAALSSLATMAVTYWKLMKNRKIENENIQLQREIIERAMPVYKKQLSEYEANKNEVMKARELLWERARICMRCGTAYLARQ